VELYVIRKLRVITTLTCNAVCDVGVRFIFNVIILVVDAYSASSTPAKNKGELMYF